MYQIRTKRVIQLGILIAFFAVVLLAMLNVMQKETLAMEAKGIVKPIPTYVLGEILVGFKDYVTRQEAEDIILKYGVAVKEDNLWDSFKVLVVSVPEGEELYYVTIFSADPDVKYAELNDLVSLCMQGETHYLEDPYNNQIVVFLLSNAINLNMYLGQYVRVEGPEIGVECMIIYVQDIEILPACYSNANCWDYTQFCAKPEGNCNGSGICNEKPSICPTLYDPVCGCNVMTYPNECVAAMNGLSVAHKGVCLLGDINIDGKVDISDVIFDLRIVLGLDPLKPCSDINNDGIVDISDVILTLRMALGIDEIRSCAG